MSDLFTRDNNATLFMMVHSQFQVLDNSWQMQTYTLFNINCEDMSWVCPDTNMCFLSEQNYMQKFITHSHIEIKKLAAAQCNVTFLISNIYLGCNHQCYLNYCVQIECHSAIRALTRANFCLYLRQWWHKMLAGRWLGNTEYSDGKSDWIHSLCMRNSAARNAVMRMM